MNNDFLENNLTAIVATYKRHNLLRQMLGSFRKYYKKLNFIIVDASPYLINIYDKYVKYISIPEFSGISYQRNIALSLVKTPYFLLIDDDFICTRKTDLLKLLNKLISNKYKVYGGKVNNVGQEKFNFHGKYKFINKNLFHFVDVENKYGLYDIIPNFFISRTDFIKKVGGRDNNLKFAKEHDDFFLNLLKYNTYIGYDEDVEVEHLPSKKYYGGEESKKCIKYFLEKWNLLNKIEVRLINKGDNKYISYYDVITKNYDIDKYISIIKNLYGNYIIKRM